MTIFLVNINENHPEGYFVEVESWNNDLTVSIDGDGNSYKDGAAEECSEVQFLSVAKMNQWDEREYIFINGLNSYSIWHNQTYFCSCLRARYLYTYLPFRFLIRS